MFEVLSIVFAVLFVYAFTTMIAGVMYILLEGVFHLFFDFNINFSGNINRGARDIDGQYEEDSENSDSDEEAFIEFDGDKVEIQLAPILADLLTCTDVEIIYVGSSNGTVDFIVPDSVQANILLELFCSAMPDLRERFSDKEQDDEYGFEIETVGADCNSCGEEHLVMTVSLYVPLEIMRELTRKVHVFLYPNGVKDIVDIN